METRQAVDHIRHHGREIAFHVRYSARRRKSISIRIDRNGTVICAAPLRTPRRRIMALMEQRADWIARHLARIEARTPPTPLQYTHGEQHLYMGRPLPLEINRKAAGRSTILRENECIRIASPNTEAEHIQKVLQKWYRRQAREVFTERLQQVARNIPWLANNEVPELKIRAMKSRWGSCSACGVITLNLHLIKAPPECLGYVITHELCHLREHNHGPRFYALVEELIPEWRSLKKRLEEIPQLLG